MPYIVRTSGIINTREGMRLKAALKNIPGLVKLVRLCRFLTNPGYRSVWLLKRDRPNNLFQPYSTTKLDRFPRIFTFVRDRLADVDSPRLLSFGCSTGEEVFTLRQYFPKAEIVGIDINPHNIAICRKKLTRSGDSGIDFKWAGSAEAELAANYDAVFAMAVLRHGDLGTSQPETCGHLIRFADYEKTMQGLCRCLRPGGYLIIRHSNFRFADTLIASAFTSELSIVDGPCDATPIYGRDNRRIINGVYNDVVLCKQGFS